MLRKKLSLDKETLHHDPINFIPGQVEIKQVTYILSSPEELALVLLDDKNRRLWDFSVQSVTKISEDCFKVAY